MSEHEKAPAEVTEPSLEELRAQGVEVDSIPTTPMFILFAVFVIGIAATFFVGWQYLRYEITKQYQTKELGSNSKTLEHRKQDLVVLEKGEKDPKTKKYKQKPIADAMRLLLKNPSYVQALPLGKEPAQTKPAPKPRERTIVPPTTKRAKPVSRATSKPKATQPASKPAGR